MKTLEVFHLESFSVYICVLLRVSCVFSHVAIPFMQYIL